MIVVAILIFVGLIIGQLRGGGLSGLVGFRLRGVWLIFVALAGELAILTLSRYMPRIFPDWLLPIQALRFLPLALFALLNIHRRYLWIIALGIALNISVITANGWRMPVSWEISSYPNALRSLTDGSRPEYMAMPGYAGANLWFLADIFLVPLGTSGFAASVGDIVLGIGSLLLIQHAMARYSIGKHVRGSLLPRAKRQDATLEGSSIVPPAKPRPQETVVEPTQVTRKPAVSPELLPQSGPLPKDDTEKVIPIKLSPRLATIASMIDRQSVVADVGCDHGKLTAWLALSGTPKVIAVDVSAKSLAKTKQLVKELGLHGVVQTRQGDGLKKLKPGEAHTIVIAGLGGPTIAEVLSGGEAQARAAVKLVLQPMNSVGIVRRWLVDNGFAITDEQLAEEDGRIYQILAAEPGQDPHPPMSLFDLEVGHLLVSRRHPSLQRLMEYKLDAIDGILSEIAENATAKAQARRSELIELRGRCTEVLEWLAQ